MQVRTESQDAIFWLENRPKSIPSYRMFDWENHLDGNSTMLDIHEFVLKRAKENNLSLEDITVFPKALDHSLKDKALVLNVWATYLSKHVETKDQTANKSLNQHMNKLTST
jgi:hypothetical protein